MSAAHFTDLPLEIMRQIVAYDAAFAFRCTCKQFLDYYAAVGLPPPFTAIFDIDSSAGRIHSVTVSHNGRDPTTVDWSDRGLVAYMFWKMAQQRLWCAGPDTLTGYGAEFHPGALRTMPPLPAQSGHIMPDITPCVSLDFGMVSITIPPEVDYTYNICRHFDWRGGDGGVFVIFEYRARDVMEHLERVTKSVWGGVAADFCHKTPPYWNLTTPVASTILGLPFRNYDLTHVFRVPNDNSVNSPRRQDWL